MRKGAGTGRADTNADRTSGLSGGPLEPSKPAVIEVPDPLGALLMKIASWREAKQGNNDRHLMDAATIASLIADPETELLRLNCASDSDRRNIRTLHQQLTNEHDYWWRNMPENRRMQGLRTIHVLSLLLDMPRKTEEMAKWLDDYYA